MIKLTGDHSHFARKFSLLFTAVPKLVHNSHDGQVKSIKLKNTTNICVKIKIRMIY